MEQNMEQEMFTEADHVVNLQSENSEVVWCATQDIIGVFAHNKTNVDIYRIEWEIQRVNLQDTPSNEFFGAGITCMQFSQDGKVFAIGDQQGCLSLHRTDTLEEVASYPIEESAAPISALCWAFCE